MKDCDYFKYKSGDHVLFTINGIRKIGLIRYCFEDDICKGYRIKYGNSLKESCYVSEKDVKEKLS